MAKKKKKKKKPVSAIGGVSLGLDLTIEDPLIKKVRKEKTIKKRETEDQETAAYNKRAREADAFDKSHPKQTYK